jgi:hypothetical protein
MPIDKFKKNLPLASCGSSLFLLVLFIYGLIPGLYVNNLASYYLMAANTDCISNQGIFTAAYCQNYGLNLGYPFLMGLPFIYASALLESIFHVTAYTANILTGAFLVLCSFMSMYYLLRKVGADKYIALFVSFFFMALSFNYGHAGYHYMMYSFMLLPFYVLVDYFCLPAFFDRAREPRIVLRIGIVYVLVKTFALFMDGYGFVISSVVSLCYVLFLLVEHRKDKRSLLVGALGFGAAYSVAVFLYKSYVPLGASYDVMSVDFFRAQGVDLISLFLPGRNMFFANAANIAKTWNAHAYFSDSSNVRFNYLGYSLTIMFIFFLIRVRNKPLFAKVIVISGCVAFFLSLGPSLKINDHRSEVSTLTFSPSDYLMPKSDATLDLHTDFIYKYVPGIRNMRGVYRWLLLFKFAMLVGVALFLSSLVRRKSYVLVALLLIITMVEMLPDLRVLDQRYRANYNQMGMFKNAVLPDLFQYLKEGEKIFYLSDENDFLANYISAKLNVRSYNCGGDKNQLLSFRSRPECIINMKRGVDVADNAYWALWNGDVTKIVIPYFNLRWDSYDWPPDASDINETKDDIARIFNGDARFVFKKSRWFEVVELNPNSLFTTEEKRGALLSDVDFSKGDYQYVRGLYQYEAGFRWSGVRSIFLLKYNNQRYLHIHIWVPELENYYSNDIKFQVKVNDTAVKTYEILKSEDIDDTISIPDGVASGKNAVVSLYMNRQWKLPKSSADKRKLAFIVKQVGFTMFKGEDSSGL